MNASQNGSPENSRSVVIEKTFRHSPETLWRALTDRSILAQWLLDNDFEPEVGRAFRFRNDPVANRDGVIDCQVLVLDRPRHLSYSWRAFGHETIVQFTLTQTDGGTHLRMEHSGFGLEQDAAFKGAGYGWQRFLGNLDRIVAGIMQ